jgi:hypothetical protein
MHPSGLSLRQLQAAVACVPQLHAAGPSPLEVAALVLKLNEAVAMVLPSLDVKSADSVLPPSPASSLEELLSAGRDLVLWATRDAHWAAVLRASDAVVAAAEDPFEEADLPTLRVNRLRCVAARV